MGFAQAKCAVLIVEDEPLIRMVAAEVFEQEGVPYFEAGDADEALDKLAHHPEIAVLFTDINMPGTMDGIALAIAVHAHEPQIELIVTSGRRFYSDSELPDSGTFLAKPYRLSALIGVVRAKLASFTRRQAAGR